MVETKIYEELFADPHLILQLALGEFQRITLADVTLLVYILERERDHIIVQLTDNEHVVRFRVNSEGDRF